MTYAENTDSHSLLHELHSSDVKLTPRELANFIPEYHKFYPSLQSEFLYIRQGFCLNQSPVPNICCLFSGLTASGKDAIIKNAFNLHPDGINPILKPVSHTTRNPRPDEQDGYDYWFISTEEFQLMIDNGEFVEHVPQYGHLYGLTHTSINTAVQQLLTTDTYKILLMKIEVSGWRPVKDHIKELTGIDIPIVSIFNLPLKNFKDHVNFLKENRPSEWQDRESRIAYELAQAAQLADVLILNDFEATQPHGKPPGYATSLLLRNWFFSLLGNEASF